MTTRDKSLGFTLGLPSFSKTHFSLCATILREKGRGIRLYLIFLLKKNFMLLSAYILLNHIRWDSLFPVISWNTQTHFKEYYFCCLFGEFGFPLSKNVCHCIKKKPQSRSQSLSSSWLLFQHRDHFRNLIYQISD